MKRKISIGWCLVSMAISALFLPELLMHGLFFDGLTYSSIARNMSEGYGSFWSPFYTNSLYPIFYEHPPLAMWLQSLWFSVFGDQFWVEKVYSLSALILSLWMMTRLWKMTGQNHFSWLPTLLFLTAPIVLWCFRNNLLENTLTLFTLITVYFLVNGMRKDLYLLTIIGSFFCIFSFLVKGPVGLFPLATPFIYRAIFNEKTQNKHLLLSLLCFATLALILYAVPDSRNFLQNYLDQQVFSSLSGEREKASRSTLILALVINLAPMIFIYLLGLTIKGRSNHNSLNWFYFFIALALCASLPMLISPKQRDFYLLPSLPYFSIAFAYLAFPYVQGIKIGSLINYRKLFLWISFIIIMIIFGLAFKNYNETLRDEYYIECARNMKNNTSQLSIKEVPDAQCYDWTMVAYLMRYSKISLRCNEDAIRICN